MKQLVVSKRTFPPIFVVFLVAGTFFMENLDGTVIVTALPQMGRTFHVDAVDLNVGMTSYLLALAVFIPISGWVADRFGARRVFASAIAAFTIASLLCGATHNLSQFVAARVLQGIGGAMMVPVGRLVVLRSTAKKDFISAIAYIVWPGLVAPILGPPVGGFITQYANWRWIFYLNLPLGVIAFVLALVLVEDYRQPLPPTFDWRTFLAFGGACTAFLNFLELCGADHPLYGRAAAALLISVALGVLSVRFTRRAESPLIDLESLKLPTYAVSIFGGSFFRTAINVAPFLLPLMFEMTFHLTAFQAGSYLLVLFLGNLAMKPMTTPLLHRFGFRTVLIVNGLAVVAASLLWCVLAPGTPVALVFVTLFVNGLCRSMQFTAISTMAFADIAKDRMGPANSFFSAVAQLGNSMGVAAGALALRSASFLHGHSTAGATLKDFHLAFLIVAGLALLGVADSFLLPKDAGSAMLRPRKLLDEEQPV
jgi:EmrB/QacA subfamily drug resistance transporter